MKKIVVFFILIFFLFSGVKDVSAYPMDPQYILVRRSPQSCYTVSSGTAWNCAYLWNGMYPEKYNINAFNEIRNTVGFLGTDTRRLGVGTIFHYNGYPMHPNRRDLIKQSLQNLLTNSLAADLPVFIVLDGYQYWDGLPNLWNWWDENMPGYDPENRNNVEWTCWDNSCAVDKAWRDWGGEFALDFPAPNLSSQAYINECKDNLKEFLPIIINWYNNLPKEKKYLLAGVALTAESDIGLNYFYYPGGVLPDNQNERGVNYSLQVGYAALSTSGIKTSGTITSDDLTLALQRYQTELYKYAYDMGFPRNKLFNHGLTKTNSSTITTVNPESVLNKYAAPGWSLYDAHTQNPCVISDLSNTFDLLDNTVWTSPEWKASISGNSSSDFDTWVNALRGTLSCNNNLFVNVSNWDQIFLSQGILNAIKQVLNETPPCYVRAPQLNTPVVEGNNVALSWVDDTNTSELTLLVTNSTEMNIQGILSGTPVFLMENVTGKTSIQKNLPDGTYYYQLLADGCNFSMRKISDRGSFTINTSTPPSTLLGDLNSDNAVNIQDAIILSNTFGKKPGETGYNQKADINSDGVINILDAIILSNSF